MSFNVSHFCGYLSYQRARKLVSGKRKPWSGNEIKNNDWSAVCCCDLLGWKMPLCAIAFSASGNSSTDDCSVLGIQFASVLLFIVTQNILTQILLPMHAVTRILLLKLLWHANEAEDGTSRLKHTYNALMRRKKGGFDAILEFLHRWVYFWRILSCTQDDTGWSCF